MKIKCENCGKEFEAKSVYCRICSKMNKSPNYHLYSDKCNDCLKK